MKTEYYWIVSWIVYVTTFAIIGSELGINMWISILNFAGLFGVICFTYLLAKNK